MLKEAVEDILLWQWKDWKCENKEKQYLVLINVLRNSPSLLTTKLQSAGWSIISCTFLRSSFLPNEYDLSFFFFLLYNDIFFPHKSAAMSLNILMSFSDSLLYLFDRILLSSNLKMGSRILSESTF